MNYISCTVQGVSTTPHELAYGVKPDLLAHFRLFYRVFLPSLAWIKSLHYMILDLESIK
jgi:hypothetical protein